MTTPISPFDTTKPPHQELEYVGFWIRVVASLIDTMLVILVTTPLLTMVYGAAYWDGSALLYSRNDWIISVLLPAVAIIVFWNLKQATPGKMLFSARIVDAKTGLAPSTGQNIGRYLAYFLSSLPFCLGFLWVAFDARKQGWHDKLAGTVVVRPKNHGAEPVSFTANPEHDDR